jgi:hypothetical protein
MVQFVAVSQGCASTSDSLTPLVHRERSTSSPLTNPHEIRTRRLAPANACVLGASNA